MDINLDLKKEYVKKQKCFSTLTDIETEKLASLLNEKHFKAGEVIVTEGDPVDSVYLIVSGMADVRHVLIKNGVPEITSVVQLAPGASIGLNETGFYSLSGIRTATVVALTDMITLRFSLPAFHGFALAYPHVNEVMRREAQTFTNSK